MIGNDIRFECLLKGLFKAIVEDVFLDYLAFLGLQDFFVEGIDFVVDFSFGLFLQD